MSVRIKVCGVTSAEDAEMCLRAGVDAIGVNLWPRSRRYCSLEVAADIVASVGNSVEVVGVFVDASVDEINRARDATKLQWVQLHGAEPPELLAQLLPKAYKAIRVAEQITAQDIRPFGGARILLDAYVPGETGGTGQTFDWQLARRVGRDRELMLAGGLNPENVAEAIRAAGPQWVDVASGVEDAPGSKSSTLVARFVQAVRSS